LGGSGGPITMASKRDPLVGGGMARAPEIQKIHGGKPVIRAEETTAPGEIQRPRQLSNQKVAGKGPSNEPEGNREKEPDREGAGYIQPPLRRPTRQHHMTKKKGGGGCGGGGVGGGGLGGCGGGWGGGVVEGEGTSTELNFTSLEEKANDPASYKTGGDPAQEKGQKEHVRNAERRSEDQGALSLQG